MFPVGVEHTQPVSRDKLRRVCHVINRVEANAKLPGLRRIPLFLVDTSTDGLDRCIPERVGIAKRVQVRGRGGINHKGRHGCRCEGRARVSLPFHLQAS